MDVRENYNLQNYNTFNISARCRYFIESDSEAELLDFVSSYEWNPGELLILGGGSNFLFTEDFEGTVFYPSMRTIEVVKEDDENVYIRVGAGFEWDDFVSWTVSHGYGGVENLSLIPGHVGASPVQNVGAYGAEAGDTIELVEAIDIEHACPVKISAAECRFGYRDSIFKHEWKDRFIITYVTFRLSKNPVFKLDYGNVQSELDRMGVEVNLENVRQAIINIRQAKLPDVKILPNGGSFFKNPIVSVQKAEELKQAFPGMPVYIMNDEQMKLAAGWMIEQCEWKGKIIGHAGVYEKQALVLVNHGGADGIEIALLANEIKKSVFMKFGVLIEPEVYIV